LDFNGIEQASPPEELGGERRDAGELEVLALGEGVADADGPVVVQADDVPREGLLGHPVPGEERRGVVDRHVAPGADVPQLHATVVLPRDDAHEGHAVPVRGIEVRLNLEHETGERGLVRLDVPCRGRPGLRCRGETHETVEQLLHAEVVDRAAEKDRRLLAAPIRLGVEGRRRSLEQFELLERSFAAASGPIHSSRAGVFGGEGDDVVLPALLRVLVEDDRPIDQVVYTPWKSLPMPMGQVIGAVWMPSCFSIESISSNGSIDSRSNLLQ
jgi:hypothetical protein